MLSRAFADFVCYLQESRKHGTPGFKVFHIAQQRTQL